MRSRRTLALFATVSVVWGVPYLLIKVADRSLEPSVIVDGRTFIGGLLLLPLALREGRMAELRRAWVPLALYCICELAVPWLLLTTAERKLSSSLSGLLIATVPIISAALAAISGHQQVRGIRSVLGLAAGLAGVAVLLGLDVGAADIGSVAMVLIVAVGYALGPLIVSRYMASYSSLALATVSLLVVAAGYLPAAVIQAPRHWPPATVTLCVIGLGVICTAVAFVAFFELIKVTTPTRATLVTYFNPVVAVILGVVVLNESFKAVTAAGFALILGGSWLAARPHSGADAPKRRTLRRSGPVE